MRTEQINPRYVELDTWSATEMIAAMYEEQLAAAAAVRGALGAITAAVEDAVPALQRGGRIVYAGAGTSGRIGVQDGCELPPTFDWPADRLVFAMAGGLDALVRSAEGAEDNEAAGAQAMAEAKIGADDVVIGIAASGTTPFTIGILRASSAAGAVTIAVANNPDAPLFAMARHRIGAGAFVVLGLLGAAHQGVEPAGHHEDDAVHRPVEGRRQFAAVLHADPPRRAGPDIDDAAALLQRRQRVLDRGGDGRERRAHASGGLDLRLVHGVEHFRSRQGIEVGVARVDALG